MNIDNLIVRPGLIIFDVISRKRKNIKVLYTAISYCNQNTNIWREEFLILKERKIFSAFPIAEYDLPIGSKIFDEILDYVDKNI